MLKSASSGFYNRLIVLYIVLSLQLNENSSDHDVESNNRGEVFCILSSMLGLTVGVRW